ncbi:MAG: iron-sulfur cluster assembly accessory protein [Pseudomonadota bacterium]
MDSIQLTLTAEARHKMAALQGEVGDEVEGIRIFATPGGCSGMSFGMTFTDQIGDDDTVCQYDDFALVIDPGTLEHIRGVEIDFADQAGDAQFLFNNLQPIAGAGCSGCPSQGGGCA